MPGLDPGIHQKESFEGIDCRVKPGNDGNVLVALLSLH
jgi:hypothetical protein